MKKLLIILHDLGAGGAEKMMTRLAGALVDAGNDVTLLMLTGGGVNAARLDPRVKKVELRQRTQRQCGAGTGAISAAQSL